MMILVKIQSLKSTVQNIIIKEVNMFRKTSCLAVKYFCLLSFTLLISAAFVLGAGVTTAFAAKKADTQKSIGIMDINSATQKELEDVKGVGPATAKKIIAGRPYKSVDELSKAGIKPKAIEAMKPFVTVGNVQAVPAKEAATKAVTKATVAVKEKKAEATKGVAVGLVDINSASQKELEAIKGVGPATAKKIIAGRPYKSVEELSKAGISAKALDSMKPFVMARSAQSVPVAAAATKVAATKTAVTATAATASSEVTKSAKTAKSTAAKLAAGTKININTADQAAIEKLPEIGPVKAKAIIDGRPYNSIEDIMQVKGIKGKTFDAIKDYIVVK
jgi:competence protein ComEA